MYQNRINYLVSTNNYPLVPANTVFESKSVKIKVKIRNMIKPIIFRK